MAWLVRDGDVLASLEVAATRKARRNGLLGRDSIEGALLLRPARSVHTLGMRFDIDVAFLDRDGVVRRTVRMRRHRVGWPCWSARSVIEAEAGAFSRWSLSVGQRLEVVE
ncbi:MAG TPA: DUF192 domain-containing protein [Acidimicrobiales bacterium]|nr:DUF192 domain-containing protein [Acidimicrobiales bacterium]